MRRLDDTLREARRLCMPYWQSDQRWPACALLFSIVVLNLLLVAISVLLTYWQREFYNALEAKDWDQFLGLLLLGRQMPTGGFMPGFSTILIVSVLVTVYALYLRQLLQINWRRWMTDRYVGQWLADHTYFRMGLEQTGTDNPDQRIAEDIRLFVDNTLLLGTGLMRAVATLLCFVVLLWSISGDIVVAGVTVHGYLVWVALAYAVLGTGLSHLIGRRLSPLHFQQQKAEADLRFGLMRLSENAEGIALHGGEAAEKRELDGRLGAVVSNWREIMVLTRRLTFMTSGYGQVVLVFPLAVTAPAYFAGRMALGGIFQASNAFVQVQAGLAWVVDNYAAVTEWLATVDRLAGFQRAMRDSRRPGIAVEVCRDDSERITLTNTDIDLPDGRRVLRDVNLTFVRGDHLLIQGPSGSGKSCLFKILAGIWPYGGGKLTCGKGTALFLPQRPYMPLGKLKHAVCYPLPEAEIPDDAVAKALEDVGLHHLKEEMHRIDAWERRLSGGEVQRLAIARALVVQPDWLFLDEATSALDEADERAIYKLLRMRLADATLTSIAHRRSVHPFHGRMLRVDSGRIVAASP
ncbi:ABC transporter ATP-binding protein/permease [Variovorax sp. dw_308]|uniref:ABC transporter ATP-binding protein/permease n=1 Tax=Variovorax sp. dw_308 TaxID=2721546 RepID=UPI001C4801C6|nr:ABC transporter ATP-binding protein/permease [Variovorax sp. dw_308]